MRHALLLAALLGGAFMAGRVITAPSAPEESSVVPSRISSLRVVSTAGVHMALDLSASGAKLLFFFRSDCAACQAIKPQWKRLALEVDGEVSLYGVQPDYDAGNLGLPDDRISIWRASREQLHEVGAVRVPMTILVGGSGEVLFSKIGLLTEGQLAMLVETGRS